jgi:hypothetical protein
MPQINPNCYGVSRELGFISPELAGDILLEGYSLRGILAEMPGSRLDDDAYGSVMFYVRDDSRVAVDTLVLSPRVFTEYPCPAIEEVVNALGYKIEESGIVLNFFSPRTFQETHRDRRIGNAVIEIQNNDGGTRHFESVEDDKGCLHPLKVGDALRLTEHLLHRGENNTDWPRVSIAIADSRRPKETIQQ